jgi:hypothetical protein
MHLFGSINETSTARRMTMKTKTNLKSGIDTVPLPERPFLGLKKLSILGIGTWPTPE